MEEMSSSEVIQLIIAGTALFNDLTVVNGRLYLNNCTKLTTLPKDMVVNGRLDLTGCTGLTILPRGLMVGALKIR